MRMRVGGEGVMGRGMRMRVVCVHYAYGCPCMVGWVGGWVRVARWEEEEGREGDNVLGFRV